MHRALKRIVIIPIYWLNMTLFQRWKLIPNRVIQGAATKDPSVLREYRQARRGEGANAGGVFDPGSFLQELDEIPAVFPPISH